ncbi:MAG: VOC family protein [Rhodoblastus sp.]|nr:MAG: VOC family protein [Rhodoblastus sp.]
MTDVASPLAAVPPLSPHLVCADAAKAIDFYVAAFGAQAIDVMRGPDGRIMHAGLAINGGGLLMLTDEAPQWGALSPLSLKGTPVTLHLNVADCDAVFARAVGAGATAVMPPADMFWGDRYAQVQDPSGHRWSIGQKLRDMTAAEREAAAKAFFAQAATCAESS